ncbi:guanine-N(7)--methyltransferase subunit trm82 [Amylocarpus encephaloides]|uniref:Guanine-N(7)--methyltransferase subunit trm82 n=1 Tax=Amylocarpus encephaloides TaxID=45428 RepID=A0A9P7YTH0_9HELO|nr:guanine-N(7)--methyltransferase subunit trm82 [Amylocarpus encephaloides]
MPYQCLERCGKLLVAARDSNIDLFNLENDNAFLSTWSCNSSQQPQNGKIELKKDGSKVATNESQLSSVEVQLEEALTPPAKRRKLSVDAGKPETEEATTEPIQELGATENGVKKQKKQKQNNRSNAISTGLEAPAIIALAVTKDEQHVIAITGEDKCIRVFEIIEKDGILCLNLLSERIMPKRPSSMAITPDSKTIFSADKFGDVYSLPLIPSLTTSTETPEQNQASRSSSAAAERTFQPSANEFTIHSQRNRIALENQKKQTNTPAKDTTPTFEHTLLLGHVSLLTDIKLASLNGRNYIITADRDEHIRVSRGIPQAHIIEGFCLGHKEFVTRMCIPESRPEILVSGGGDNRLLVWNWEAGKCLSEVDLGATLRLAMGGDGVRESKMSVSGIYHIRQAGGDMILVACEALPVLFLFNLNPQNTLTISNISHFPGNILSLNVLPTQPKAQGSRVVISIDNIHKPSSTTETHPPGTPKAFPLVIYDFENGPSQEVVKTDQVVNVEVPDAGNLKKLLYSLENLRKKGGEGKADGAEVEDS